MFTLTHGKPIELEISPISHRETLSKSGPQTTISGSLISSSPPFTLALVPNMVRNWIISLDRRENSHWEAINFQNQDSNAIKSVFSFPSLLLIFMSLSFFINFSISLGIPIDLFLHSFPPAVDNLVPAPTPTPPSPLSHSILPFYPPFYIIPDYTPYRPDHLSILIWGHLLITGP